MQGIPLQGELKLRDNLIKMPSKVEILSVETIKPTSPTPHLRTFQLSHWDLIAPPKAYSTFIFFYRSNSDQTNQNTVHTLAKFFIKSRILKRSLSKTLVHYYPLAGRLINDATIIDCNDEGAFFVEAHYSDHLFSFLNKPDAKLLNNFIPEVDESLVSRVVLVVQLTAFDCGGIAVSINISHRLADACSFCTFIKSWISIIRGDEKLLKPIFLESSSFPPKYLPKPEPDMIVTGEFVTKRFVLSVSKIEALKAKVSKVNPDQQKQPSNVDVVMAIIMKSVITAAKTVSGISGPTFLFQLANMRKRVSPPFPNNTIGNIYTIIPTVFEEKETELNDLIITMRRSKTQFYKKNKVETTGRKRCKDIYGSSSLCKFPIYDTDFGWGKPLWVVCTPTFYKNQTILLDTREGDGIEAWVSLDEKQMAVFENQNEILAFGSVNPSVLFNYSRM